MVRNEYHFPFTIRKYRGVCADTVDIKQTKSSLGFDVFLTSSAIVMEKRLLLLMSQERMDGNVT